MDLPPTIPTSFVPQSTTAAVRKFRSDFTGAFGFFAYGVLGVVFLLSVGVFVYGRMLASTQAKEDAALAKAEASIEPATVVGFVRLRDRLNSGTKLIASHVALSGFFNLVETLLPTTVRFVTIHLSLDDNGKVTLDGSGVAKSFNALAAASTAFATDGNIKEAIFSNIVVNRDGSVSFAISAKPDPKLVTFSP